MVGSLVELSASGASALLTAAFSLVVDAQKSGEPVAWIGLPASGMFFPPDGAAAGVDLSALAVVRMLNVRAAVRAADVLTRCGGFGLIVLDLATVPYGYSSTRFKVPEPYQVTLSPTALTRLAGLAHKHQTAVLFLTEKPAHAPSLGSLIALRAEVSRVKGDVEVHVIKDKRRGPGAVYREACHGPAGLC